ncbi:hypothetical protein BC830DRAFT_718763 [Chytriomyces sp. MP71]|nr:hypothetical protein BC830DRAFT_718763 [Chytriomyces sp. MP71]
MLAGHTLLLIATLLLLKTCHAVTTTSIDWHPLGDTDTGNEACAQDIGYQMISMSENGHANMVSGGRSVDYCEAQMPDVFKYGCTVGFVGFRT